MRFVELLKQIKVELIMQLDANISVLSVLLQERENVELIDPASLNAVSGLVHQISVTKFDGEIFKRDIDKELRNQLIGKIIHYAGIAVAEEYQSQKPERMNDVVEILQEYCREFASDFYDLVGLLVLFDVSADGNEILAGIWKHLAAVIIDIVHREQTEKRW
jgi:hypothetical protein